MFARNIAQAQFALTPLTFAKYVRFRGARNAVARMKQIIEKTAERRIFGAAARYVARKNTKERVDDKKR